MIIELARYGVDGLATVDVTASVRKLVVHGQLVIPRSLDVNLLFGDPCPGHPKTLTVLWRDGAGPRQVAAFGEYDGRLVDDVVLGDAVRPVWPVSSADRTGRTVVCYAYFEKNAAYRDNLAFFLRHGLLDDAEHVIAINGACSLEIPERPNLRVIRRPNRGFDFGGHADAVESLTETFDRYVFLNATCRGPFLPPWTGRRWPDVFGDLLTGDVHLVGASISVQYNFDWLPYYRDRFGWDRQAYPAVESYVFMLDRAGFEIARRAGIFDPCEETDLFDVVFKREIALSLAILADGGNIDCLIPEMRGVDYRTCLANFNPSHFTPTRPGGCFGRSLHPYEMIFLKQNRGICDAEVESLTAWFDRPVSAPADP